MIRFEHIAIGSGGGPSCRRCTVAGAAQTLRESGEIAADVAAATLAWDSSPGPNLLFGGAEPFAHPALPALIGDARTAGVERIGLVTDGGALARDDNAGGALHAGVRHIVLCTIGVDDDADERSGRPGLSQAVLDGIAAFGAAATATGVAVAVSAEVAVCRHNIERLSEAVVALAQAGVGSFSLIEQPEATPAGVRATTLIAAACDTGVVNGAWVEVRGLPLPSTHALHRSRDGGAS